MQQNVVFFEIPLFLGFSEIEITELLDLLRADESTYESEKIIIHEGDPNPYIYIVLSGEVIAVKYNLSGREELYTKFTAGDTFGDMLAVSAGKESPVTVKASAGVRILKFKFEQLAAFNSDIPELQTRLLKNLTAELAQKYFDLQDRVNFLTRVTLRDKILAYLENESKKQKGINFNIPLNRERLAAFLNTDRSALSRELSNMKKEGILDFYKNSFKIVNIEQEK